MALVGLWMGPSIVQAQVGTAFTYQGRLTDGGAPATGTYDFRMILFDADVGGSQQGPIVTVDDVAVAAGHFTASLDFGVVFAGDKRWLEIAVRPGASSGAYGILSPRQELTPAPNALYAANATTVAGLTCANNQVAKWSGTGWTCGSDNDTAPTASLPIVATGNNISLATCFTGQVFKMTGGVWACAADLNTTYTNGGGLTLASGVFDTNNAVVARKDAAAGSQAFNTNTLVLSYTLNRVGIGTASPSGPLTVSGGIAAADANGGHIRLESQDGGADGADGNDQGGRGGSIELIAGTGGPGNDAGDIVLGGAAGGPATATAAGGEGSDFQFAAGNGGNGAFTNSGGAGGNVVFNAGAGGSNTGGGTGGGGGSLSLASGSGGVTTGGGTGGGGGNFFLTSGSGGTNNNGGVLQLEAGPGNGTGNGGSVTIMSGGSTSGSAGEITLLPGSSSSGVDGAIQLGGTTTAANSTTLGPIKVHIMGGDINVVYPGKGIILRSPNGSVCRLLSITDAGALATTAVTCP
jgi:hypothetical protein